MKKNRLILLFYLMVVIVPFGAGVFYALLNSFGLIGTLNHGVITLEHWVKALNNGEFTDSLFISFYIAATALSLTILLGLGIALNLRKELGKGYFSTFIYFPLALPAIVTAFFIFQLLSKSGLLSRLFYQLHLVTDSTVFPDLINDHWSIGIILAHTLMALPFFTIMFNNLYRTEQIESLKMLAGSMGATNRQCLQKITLPILLSNAFPSLVLYFIFILGSYEIPLVLGRQSPQMISVLIIRKMKKFDLHEIPQAYALAILYTGIVFTSLRVLFYWRKKHAF